MKPSVMHNQRTLTQSADKAEWDFCRLLKICVCRWCMLFMCCMYVSVWAHMPICTHGKARAGRWVPPPALSAWLLWDRLSLNWKLTRMAKLAGQLALRICPSLPSNDWVKCKLHALMPSFSCGCWGSNSNPWCLQSQCSYPPSHLLKTVLTDQ